jgi:5-formyltetrahydrofolate cyclo-ligase
MDTNLDVIASAKGAAREQMWKLLEHERAVPIPPGAHDRIPNFLRATEAADRLVELPEWRDARVIKANPDKAQGPLRVRALLHGKRVYMAVPKLAGDHPFVLLDPEHLPGRADDAATSEGGMALGRPVLVAEMEPIDLVICGSVAVNESGARLGKGGGYADLELAFLMEACLLGDSTPLVTTVDDLQVQSDPLPDTEHDFRVDVIVTPTRVIRTLSHHRPPGVLWDHLDPAKIATIPVLARHVRDR